MTKEEQEALEAAEEERFCSELDGSWDDVWRVVRYLHRKGNLWVCVGPTEIRPTREHRRTGYGDVCDIFVRAKDQEDWYKVEVKGRQLVFTSCEDFPYPTIFIDRCEKVDASNAAAYFTVNAAGTHAALIRRTTKPSWIGPITYHDSRKNHPVTVYECPKELAEFVIL